MPAYNPADYEPVEDRIRAFYKDYPDGRITTDLEYQDADRCIVKAYLWLNSESTMPKTTGYAEELRGSNPVNRTSHVENCETSAIGRALANANYATKKRPSREEMAKTVARDSALGVSTARNELRSWCAKNKVDLGKVASAYNAIHGHALIDEPNPELIKGFLELLKMDTNAVLNSKTEEVKQ